MRFIFTEKTFYLEEGGILSEELQAWQEEFKKDKKYAWYLLVLKGVRRMRIFPCAFCTR